MNKTFRVSDIEAAAAIPPAPPLAAWAGFAAMCVGMFMAILDIQVVATSLPTIQEALHIAKDKMSWIQTAYLIAEVIAIPLTGLLTRALTMRWLLVTTTRPSRSPRSAALSAAHSRCFCLARGAGLCRRLLIPQVFAAVLPCSAGADRRARRRSPACWP